MPRTHRPARGPTAAADGEPSVDSRIPLRPCPGPFALGAALVARPSARRARRSLQRRPRRRRSTRPGRAPPTARAPGAYPDLEALVPTDVSWRAAPRPSIPGRNCTADQPRVAAPRRHHRGPLRRRDVDVRGRAGASVLAVFTARRPDAEALAAFYAQSATGAARTQVTGESAPRSPAGPAAARHETAGGPRPWSSGRRATETVNVVITNDLPDARIQDAIDASGAVMMRFLLRHGASGSSAAGGPRTDAHRPRDARQSHGDPVVDRTCGEASGSSRACGHGIAGRRRREREPRRTLRQRAAALSRSGDPVLESPHDRSIGEWAARARLGGRTTRSRARAGARAQAPLLDASATCRSSALYGPWSLAEADPLATSAFPASRRSPAASTRPATAAGSGRCGCSPASAPPRTPTPGSASCSAAGQTGLSIAYDMPTLYGYDTDDPEAEGEFGTCGVAVSSLADMEVLLGGLPLERVSTSMTINSPAAPIWAMYIVAAEKAGRAARPPRGDDPERHPQGVRRPEGVPVPAGAVDAPRDRHDRVRDARDAALEHRLDQRLPHPRGGLDRGPGAGLHDRRRDGLRRGGPRARAADRRLRAAARRSSSTATATSSRRSPSSAPRAGSGTS